MYYYVIDYKIKAFNEPFDSSLYDYYQLTEDQATFYEANPKANLDEVLQMELYPQPEFNLTDYKTMKTSEFSQLAFDLRGSILPEYKLINAGVGVYDEATVLSYKLTVQAFRDEFYRLSGLIDEATTKEAVDSIEHNYPSELVTE